MTRTAELTPLLKRLQLGPMAATLPERIALARTEQLDYASFLEINLSDEVNRRPHRRIELRLNNAGFEETCRLEDFHRFVVVEEASSCWRVVAGMMALISVGVGVSRIVLLMASLNPSAAARVMVVSVRLRLMPVRMGRESSFAAAKAVREMAVRRSLGLIEAVRPSVRVGCGGKSLGSAPLMFALALAQERLAIMEPSATLKLTGSFGRVLMNSVRSLAGMAMEPSLVTMASTLVVIEMFRLVAVRVIPSWVVLMRTFWMMGMGALPGTAREMVLRPL